MRGSRRGLLVAVAIVLFLSPFAVAAQADPAAHDVAMSTTGQTPDDSLLARILAEAKVSQTDALRIWKEGRPILVYDRPDAPEQFPLQSVTKGVVALAVLKLVEDGHLESLDQPVHTLYPEWRQGRKKLITVQHILSHTSGLQNEANVQAELAHLPDRVQAALAAELSEDPGTSWSYNNKAYGLLAGIIERASGATAEEYIGKALLEPLGISDAKWSYDPSGRNLSVIGGLHLRPDELARIGQLLIDRGRYDGRQVLAAELIDQALAPGLAVGRRGAMGLGWFLDRRIIRVEFGASALQLLSSAPVDPAFLRRAEQLRGVYPDYLAFRDSVARVFGSEHEFDTTIREHGVPIVASLDIQSEDTPSIVMHSGDGGQYLYVLPAEGIVVVRLIRDLFTPIMESPEFQGDTSDPDIGRRLSERFQTLSEETGFWNLSWLVSRL